TPPDFFAPCNQDPLAHLDSAAFNSRDVERGAIYAESLDHYLAGSNPFEAEAAVTPDSRTCGHHRGRERVFIRFNRRRRHGIRYDYRLREAGFCGLIGVLDDGYAADRRATFRSDLDSGHIGALNLEFCSVAVIIAACARQNRRGVDKAQLILSRRETVEVEIALLIRLGCGAERAEIHALAGASDFCADHRG